MKKYSKSVAKIVKNLEINWENYYSEPDDPWRKYIPEEPHPRPQFICPHCRIKLINFARLEKHIGKVHLVESMSANLVKPNLTPVIDDGVVSLHSSAGSQIFKDLAYACQFCSAVMKNAQRLKSHMIKIHQLEHNSKNPRKTKTASSKNSPIKNSSKSTAVLKNRTSLNSESNSYLAIVNEPPERMDATKGWGGSFRDNGQFGSHPMYDSMDDESFS